MYGDNERKVNYLLITAGVVCFIVAAVLLHSFKGQFGKETAGVASVESQMPVMEETLNVEQKQPAAAPPQEWVIYVTGAVKKPGVYKISPEARIYQALEAAGGFNADADKEAVNLAAKLEDGSQVHFPAKGEKQETQSQTPPSAPVKTPGIQAKTPDASRLVNINTARQDEIETLPGIGPKTALSIIAYREANGAFKRIEDLLLIKGIGAKKYDAVKSMVTVGN